LAVDSYSAANYAKNGARANSIWTNGLPGGAAAGSLSRVSLPYKISTLLYCFNERDDVLLMERAHEPNRGLWSPCGGKLRTETGESPHACGCREAGEEMGIKLSPTDLHLTGIIAESGYQGQSHWLMFLFEVKRRLKGTPPPHDEGTFRFFKREELPGIKMPKTDFEQIWPLFWKHRAGFFAARCECHEDGRDLWTVEESHPKRGGA
jgi:8-oxo-dGTP diphosphatase